MRIANYDEFIQVINSLFNSDEVNDFASFASELAKSKKTRNIKRNRHETALKKLKADMEEYKQKLRTAQSVSDKRQFSDNLKELNKVKQELIKQHKEVDTLNLFNEMSEESKIYACCRHLLTKYLPQVLSEDLSHAATVNPDGSLSVNPQAFKDSHIYRDAAHIKDYISSYFENYPERIKGTRYFVGLHKKSPALSDLLKDIDTYFEKLNSPSEKESNRIKKSHTGIKTVTIYPEQHLQAVQLLTKASLNYEGSALHHCVGSYASKVENGETRIYSLRDIGDTNQELIPHATVEIKSGEIKQIKGANDSVIAFQYVNTVRDMLMKLTKSNDFQDIINNDEIPMVDKNNIGIFKDVNGKMHDLFDSDVQNATFEAITITQEALTALPLHKMNIRHLQYRGVISQEGLTKLFKLPKVGKLSFSNLQYMEGTLDYSLSDQKDTDWKRVVSLNVTAPNVKQIIFPAKTDRISLSGNFDSLETLDIPDSTKILYLNGYFPNLRELHTKAEDITLEGKFYALEVLQENVSELGIKGEFPKLKVEISNLKSLNLQSAEIIKNIKWTSAPALHSLSLYGEGVECIKELPKAPLLENLKIGSGTYELGTQLSVLKNNFTAEYPLLSSLILNGRFSEIEELDLSLNGELVEFEVLGAKFDNLKSIKFPHKLNSCVLDFATFPMLKELDLSAIDSKQFGYLEDFNISGLRFGGYIGNPSRHSSFVKGVSTSFAHFDSLETLKFPLKSEKISLQNFIAVERIKNFNFDELHNLKELNLSLCKLKDGMLLDLSDCHKLTTLDITGNILKNTTLPTNVGSLIVVGEQDDLLEISLNNNGCNKLKELKCFGFLPDSELLKPSVENLILRANNLNLDRLTEINMERYKYVDMQMMGSSLKKLKKIVFPQRFKQLSLQNTSSDLQELDFSHTRGKVRVDIQPSTPPVKSYYRYSRKGISEMVSEDGPDNLLLLTKEQMQNIRNIRIGKNTDLFIDEELTTSPDLFVTLPEDMNEIQIKKNQGKNPRLKFVREKSRVNANTKGRGGKGRN